MASAWACAGCLRYVGVRDNMYTINYITNGAYIVLYNCQRSY